MKPVNQGRQLFRGRSSALRDDHVKRRRPVELFRNRSGGLYTQQGIPDPPA